MAFLLRQQRDHLIGKLDAVLSTLRSLPPGEIDIGWDDNRADNWVAVLGKLRAALAADQPLPRVYDSFVIVRGLDMDGICAGEIFDKCVEIGSELQMLVRFEGTAPT